MTLFLYSDWHKLPLETRIKIAQIFGITKIRSTHVADNRVVDDGYLVEDIEAKLTEENMKTYLVSGFSKDASVFELFRMVIAKVEGRVPEEVVETVSVPEEVVPETPTTEDPQEVVSETNVSEPEVVREEVVEKPEPKVKRSSKKIK